MAMQPNGEPMFVRVLREDRADAVAAIAELRAEIAATAKTNAALHDALRAWRDANRAYYTNASRHRDPDALWSLLLDAELALRIFVDAMDANAAQPEHTP